VEVDKFHPSCVNWFEDVVARKIGNCESSTFWLQRWAGRTLLKDRFCRLFVTINKNAMILDILKTNGNRREWLWNWGRPLFAWEDEQLKDLLELLKDVTLTYGIEDKWVFTIDKTSDSTVRTTYNHLQKLMKQDQRDILSDRLFKHLWSYSAPMVSVSRFSSVKVSFSCFGGAVYEWQ
jgi:hypothetical protein